MQEGFLETAAVRLIGNRTAQWFRPVAFNRQHLPDQRNHPVVPRSAVSEMHNSSRSLAAWQMKSQSGS
jgi:hypothetical protein